MYKAQNKYPSERARRVAAFAEQIDSIVSAWRESQPLSSEIHGVVTAIERQYVKHVLGRFNDEQRWTRDSIIYHLTHVDSKDQLRHELVEQKDRLQSASRLLMSHAFVQSDEADKVPAAGGNAGGDPAMVVDPRMFRAWADTEKMLSASLKTLSDLGRLGRR